MGKTEREIKIGDHVRGTAGSQGYYTQPGELLEAVVTDLNPDGDVRIRVIRHTKFKELPEIEVADEEIELIKEGGRLMSLHTAEKKILDVTCGSRSIWFDKHHPAAIYCDKRREEIRGVWKSGDRQSERTCNIAPDVQCDFTDLPFEDNSFALVVWDPPHLRHVGENAWLAKKYGQLDDEWPQMLHDGFRECMRVLKPDGVLIFKWAETQIPAVDVWKAIGEKPLFGHHSGKRSQTFWGCFMKMEKSN